MKHRIKRACQEHLQATFQLDDFRPGQRAAAYALLAGRDLLCVLPTGAGKSLCWQLPAVVHEGLTVVVSPLIALMQDQVRRLQEIGVPAAMLHSLMSLEEKQTALAQLRSGHTRIVFVAPERLMHPEFRSLCAQCPPWLIVVDEAHCLVQWGQDFRPAYASIADFARMLPRRPVLCAMTATADCALQKAVIASLGMQRPKRIVLPILRENLHYEARTTLDRTGNILRIAAAEPGKMLVFCRTRARTEALAQRLRQQGVAADFYHAGMERWARDEVQMQFQTGRIRVLAATTAFGMGVDIPDIRCVLHDHLPAGLIDYVQQTGRAGRDGAPANCVLLLEPNDLRRKGSELHRAWRRLRWRPMERWRFIRKEWRPTRQLLQAVMASPCIAAALACEFGQHAPRCGTCSACRHGPLVKRVPDLPRLDAVQTAAYFLRWQRDAIASKRCMKPRQVLSERGISFAARRLILPENAGAEARAMQRLLLHLQRKSAHADDAGGA